jgi:hypothetical protein
MAISQEMLDALISVRGPYLYHGGRPEQRELFLSEGLQPRALTGNSNSAWAKKGPQFASRPGHVYLGSLSHLERLTLEPLVEVDLRALDPSRICTDEDVFWEMNLHRSGDWRLHQELAGQPDLPPPADLHISRGGSEPSSIPELADSMRSWMETGPSFGDWADVYASLIDQTEWVALSIAFGSIAYEGPVPAHALRAYTPALVAA